MLGSIFWAFPNSSKVICVKGTGLKPSHTLQTTHFSMITTRNERVKTAIMGLKTPEQNRLIKHSTTIPIRQPCPATCYATTWGCYIVICTPAIRGKKPWLMHPVICSCVQIVKYSFLSATTRFDPGSMSFTTQLTRSQRLRGLLQINRQLSCVSPVLLGQDSTRKHIEKNATNLSRRTSSYPQRKH